MDRFMDRFISENDYKYALAGHPCHSATHLPRSQTPKPATRSIMAPTQSKLITRQDAAAATHNHFMTFTAGILSGLRGVKDTPHGDVFAVYDFINLCNKKPIGDAYGGVTFNRIIKKHSSKIIIYYMKIFTKTTPCLTILGLQTLLRYMPGNFADQYHDEINHAFMRILAGDMSLIPVIEANNKSTEPIHEMAREWLDQQSQKPPPPKKINTRFLYATQSPAFPGAVKIGRATCVKSRVSSGNTFVRLSPHKIVAVAPSLDYKRDEKLAHSFFASRHIKGEFFQASIQEVSDFFTGCIEKNYHQELRSLMSGLTVSNAQY